MIAEWKPEMVREVSGFGGAYENACRAMVVAGVAWLQAHPEAEFLRKVENEAAVTWERTAACDELEAAIAMACPDCTGAMMGAAVQVVRWVQLNGWEAYVAFMSEPEVSVAEAKARLATLAKEQGS